MAGWSKVICCNRCAPFLKSDLIFEKPVMTTRFVASMRNMTVDSETVMLDACRQDRQPLPVTTNIGKTIIMESKPDHLETLIQRYPRLFHGEPPPAISEVPPEWADLIDKLCADIDQLVLKDPSGSK